MGGHGTFNQQNKTWQLEGGRTLEFGSVQAESDVDKYRGRPRDLNGFDELTEFSEAQFRFLGGWVRTTIEGQRCRVVCTFNPPTDARGRWVVRYFAPWIDKRHPSPAKDGELRWYAMVDGEEREVADGSPFEHNGETIEPTSRTFFSARLADNPRLMSQGYGRTLQALPEPLRSQLLYGDFDADSVSNPWQVIPTAWVEAAMGRWHERQPDVPMTALGMDVAHGGKDQTVLAPRYGDYFGELEKYPGSATPDGTTAASYAARLAGRHADIMVDAIGYGASAAERLSEEPPMGHGLASCAVNVGAGSRMTDRSGRFRMVNLRAEMYWRLREALDPEYGATLALPPDSELLADLTEPTYEIRPAGIKIESKDDIKARLSGRSPDCGDAVCLAMLEPDGRASWGLNPFA